MSVIKDRRIRALAASTLITTGGDGLYIAGSALFFTRALGFSVAQVGLGLTLAGILGLGAGVPLGRLADRRGARDVLIVIELIQAAAIGSYVLVGGSLPAFIGVATVVIACMQGADAAKGALAGNLAAEDPVRLRAFLQSVSNAGISVGTVFAGLAIADGSHLAYRVLMLADAATFVIAAVCLLVVPRATAVISGAAERGRRWVALRDRPYLALTAANCVMSLQYFVLAFAMPLWVIDHTHAPRWLVSPMLLSNTLLIVALQVRFSRATKTAEGGARSVSRAGIVLAAAMVLYGAAAGRVQAVAVIVLLAAVVAHTVGELFQSAGAFGISYGLAQEDALGEYLGVYGLGIGVCRAVAPGVLAVTCLQHGDAGWLGLAAVFLLSGFVTPSLVRRARVVVPLPSAASPSTGLAPVPPGPS